MSASEFAAVILAAGLSSRMGGTPKPLLKLGSGTIADHVLDTFLNNHVDVYLVVGHRRDEVVTSLKASDVTVVENKDYERGMFTSVQAGTGKLPPGHKWFFVLPVDIPLIREATVARLMKEAARRPGAIIYPVFAGRRGHPVLVPSRLIQPILQWSGDGGLRAVLRREKNTVEVAVPDAGVVFDVDSPEDYRELTDRFARIDTPTALECEVVMNDVCSVQPSVREHCLKVAEVADRICAALMSAGSRVDRESVRAAATLHDVAKGQPDHDSNGAELLRDLGFDGIARMVAVHTDLAGQLNPSLEAKVVFLADKLVMGTQLVTVEERYERSRRKYSATPEIGAAIAERRDRALEIKRELEAILGRSLEDVNTGGDGSET